MARHALLIGSSGPEVGNIVPLCYIRQDIARIKECLESSICGFTSTILADKTLDVWDVRRAIAAEAARLKPEDTFVCYFTGHGYLGTGGLYFLWDYSDPDQLYDSALPATAVLEPLRHCKAKNKLLILDCCNAGAVVNSAGMKGPDIHPDMSFTTALKDLEHIAENYQILLASARGQKAFEIESLQGSFLSTYIYRALKNNIHAIDSDRDGRISLDELEQWIQIQAHQYNTTHPTQPVPIPYTFGQRRGPFFLTKERPSWPFCEITLNTTMKLIAIPRYANGSIICVSKNLITNEQYREFVNKTGYQPPSGKHFNKQWEGPFFPWSEHGFQETQKPVVCVSALDALSYCLWLNSVLYNTSTARSQLIKGLRSKTDLLDIFRNEYCRVRLLSLDEWNIAAFGSIYPPADPKYRFMMNKGVHHKAMIPCDIDQDASRINNLGFSDLIGNVWEWCMRKHDTNPSSTIALLASLEIGGFGKKAVEFFANGGGFLDDISKIDSLSIHESRLIPDTLHTAHTDLGFRICIEIDINGFSQQQQHEIIEYTNHHNTISIR